MPPRVLFTAFGPFDFKGGVTPSNSSGLVRNQVSERLRSEIDYHVLPVYATATSKLDRLLQAHPHGGLMGGGNS